MRYNAIFISWNLDSSPNIPLKLQPQNLAKHNRVAIGSVTIPFATAINECPFSAIGKVDNECPLLTHCPLNLLAFCQSDWWKVTSHLCFNLYSSITKGIVDLLMSFWAAYMSFSLNYFSLLPVLLAGCWCVPKQCVKATCTKQKPDPCKMTCKYFS